MKIRDGFVTNSSSTSYCIVGVDDALLVAEIVDAIERVGVEDYACAMKLQVETNEYGDAMVGFDAETTLQNRSIAQVSEDFIELVKQTLGVDVAPGDVRLIYGGYYNG